jgi:hypothetical protein
MSLRLNNPFVPDGETSVIRSTDMLEQEHSQFRLSVRLGQEILLMASRPFIALHDFRAILRRIIELTPTTKHFEW